MNSGSTRDWDAVDVKVASAARMYDYLLGGIDNYRADVEACRALLEIAPSSRELARSNREFLERVVETLAREYGVRQFIDHGSGLPTQSNVHQIAQRIDRDARVVYIDNDPLVIAHGRSFLEENDNVVVVENDMTRTDEIFTDPEVKSLIDFAEPVAALFVSVLHCVQDDADPGALVRRVAARLAPGSFVVVCQLVSEDEEVRSKVTELMARQTGGRWGRVRQEDDVRGYFAGLDVLEPGLVEVSSWRPGRGRQERQPGAEWIEFGGVGQVTGGR